LEIHFDHDESESIQPKHDVSKVFYSRPVMGELVISTECTQSDDHSCRQVAPVASCETPSQNKLYQALQEQQWLLEESQHLEVPPTHLDNYNGQVFLIVDFVKGAG
jgi:glyceraldehyde-3-phosphate dehydrogenase/erythrose-4-phosphate dehydrogenase